MKLWRLSLALTLVLCGATAFASPAIGSSNPTYFVSIQAAGATVEHMFVVTNTGDQTLEISDIVPSCTCTTVMPNKAELEPGKSIGITVSVDTPLHRVHERYDVKSNDPVSPEFVLSISVTVAGKAEAKLPTITVTDFQELFYLLVDVRTPEEFASGHLLGAVNIPLSEFQNNLSLWAPRLPRDVTIILQCKGDREARRPRRYC